MAKYANGKIYKVLNTIDDEIYVGSTTQPLSKRMYEHRGVNKSSMRKSKVYTHMTKLGVDNFYIELIEQCPCKTIEELNAKEGEWIRKIATLNVAIAGRNKKEYNNEHKHEAREWHRAWRANNLQKRAEQERAWVKRNMEHKKEYDKQYQEKTKIT